MNTAPHEQAWSNPLPHKLEVSPTDPGWLVSRDEAPFKPDMIAHASHCGDPALEQLNEVLKTMSFRLVEMYSCGLGCPGKPMRPRQSASETLCEAAG